MTVAAIAALALLQIQAPKDSSSAVNAIVQSVRSIYEWGPRRFENGGIDTVHVVPWWVPPPRRTPGNCRGETLMECLGGDWSCRVVVNCTHPAQAQRRARAIQEVERLAPLVGGSDLAFRQRVTLALKHGEPARAKQIADSCYGVEWWCKTLRGFAEHWIHPGRGLVAFDSAMSLASLQERCMWLDIGALAPNVRLSGSCVTNNPALTRFWWLADPLWTREGNERYADHFARWVMMEAERDYWSGYESCRYLEEGYPNSRRVAVVQTRPYDRRVDMGIRKMCLDKDIPTYGQVQNGPDVVRTQAEFAYQYGGYSFVPDSARFVNPLESVASDWQVTWNEGRERLVTRERYHSLEHQVVVLRRGTQFNVIAAAHLPPELAQDPNPAVALALGRIDDLHLVAANAHYDSTTRAWRAAITVDSGSYVGSFEAITPAHVARARQGLPGPAVVDGFGVSNLALVSSTFEPGSSGVERALLPTLTVSRDSAFAVYFEIYGAENSDAFNIILTGQSERRGVLDRVLGAVGLRSDVALRVSWREEQAAPSGIIQRAFAVNAKTLPVGEAVLTLSVQRRDGKIATVSRKIWLTR